MAETLTAEQRDFLLKGTRTGKIATVRQDGRVHIVPVWFIIDGDDIVFGTGSGSVKAKNMRRTSQATLCTDDEVFPYAYIAVEGTAALKDDPPDMVDWSTRIAARYVGEDKAAEYGKMNGGPGSTLVRITPTKVLFVPRIAG